MKTEKHPPYFVQTQDGQLWGYYRSDILLCDLAINKGEKVTIFERRGDSFRIQYTPITEETLRARAAS